MLQGGAGALREMRKEMREFGGVFNRFGALQVVRAIDAITRLKFAIGGLMTQLTIRVAPVIERVVMFAVDVMKKIDVNTLFERIMRGVSRFVVWTLETFAKLTSRLSMIFHDIGASVGAKWLGLEGLGKVGDALRSLTGDTRDLVGAWFGLVEQYEKFEAGLKYRLQGTPYLPGGYMDYLERLQGLQGRLTGPTPAFAGAPRFAREIESERFNLRALQLGAGDTIPQQQLEEQKRIRAAIESLETALEKSTGFPE